MHHLLRAVMLVLLTLLTAGPLMSQEPPPEKRKTPRERALEKLRGSSSVVQPTPAANDTTRAAQDTPRVRVRTPATPDAVPNAVPRDSLMESLLTLPGYNATEYLGGAAVFDSDSGKLELKGASQVLREGSGLAADSLITYDLDRAVVCGYGNPVLSGQEAGAPVQSSQVCYDVERKLGLASGARTKFTQGANWYVVGDRVYTRGSDEIFSHDAKFTDCDLETPHYHFQASEVKMRANDVLVARDVTLNFQDVPVFWLPFMFQSLKEGRRSGLLAPDVSINSIVRTQTGYRRRVKNVGFYWAISDYLGAQVALDWFSATWTGLDGAFDYNFRRQFLQGAARFTRYWESDGGRRFTLSTHNSWRPNERTTLNVTGNYTSSAAFVRRNTFDPNELDRSIDSNVSFGRNFDWGGITAGAQRRHHLSDDRIDLTLPTLNLNINAITLFAAEPVDARWYNNATWSGSARTNFFAQDVSEEARDTLPRPITQRDRSNRETSINSDFRLGKFSWRQSVAVSDSTLEEREQLEQDTIALPHVTSRVIGWNMDFDFQQRLIGTTTFTPGLRIRGRQLERSGDPLVSGSATEPTRLDFTAALKADLYGFWPGVGPFTRIRHRFSPNVSYNYSPEVRADTAGNPLLRGTRSILEQNQISIGLNQTFEAKRRESAEDEQQPDTTTTDSIPTGPRRRTGTQPLTLLSITTNAAVWDFVRAREDTIGDLPGLETGSISNSISSDLFRGLTLQFTHDLFEERVDTANQRLPRRFAPQLSSLNASFSLSNESWIFRILGLGRKTQPEEERADEVIASDTVETRQASRRAGGLGLVQGRGSARPTDYRREAAGTWSANFNFNITRAREGARFETDNQMVSSSLSFQPTPAWRVSWQTAYSLTESEFTNHTLTFQRDLHDWVANFDFFQAQNGNFAFQFRVHLRANPELKLDYDQRGGDVVRR